MQVQQAPARPSKTAPAVALILLTDEYANLFQGGFMDAQRCPTLSYIGSHPRHSFDRDMQSRMELTGRLVIPFQQL